MTNLLVTDVEDDAFVYAVHPRVSKGSRVAVVGCAGNEYFALLPNYYATNLLRALENVK